MRALRFINLGPQRKYRPGHAIREPNPPEDKQRCQEEAAAR